MSEESGSADHSLLPFSPHSDSSHKTQLGACLQATLPLNYLHLYSHVHFSQTSGILLVTVKL